MPLDKEQEQGEFLAENEVMDLSPIRDKTFAVAVATGMPNSVKYLCSTIHGPYNFTEMLQEVGDMWVREQHHAKVIVLEKDINSRTKVLDDNTVDYIEAHYVDLIMDEALAEFEDKEYTCEAGVVFEEDDANSSK